MPRTGGGWWNSRLLTDNGGSSLLSFFHVELGLNCWPLLSSPDHSPPTRLCNSQNIPPVIIVPTKKINKQIPAFHLIFLTVVCHCWLSPSSSFFVALDRHEIFSPCVLPLLCLSSTRSRCSPTHHPFLIGPHISVCAQSLPVRLEEAGVLSAVSKTFALVVGCSFRHCQTFGK